MRALILCAGYATRLYPLTLNTPKPLLKVAGKTIVEHILEKINHVDEIDEVLIVTNARFFHQFKIWQNHLNYPKKIKIINDGTINNDDRLGTVGDINFVLKEEEINDDLLVIGGDNLFDFSLKDFFGHYRKIGKSIVAFRDLKDKDKVKDKFGVGILENTKVINFEEKPSNPRSSLAATFCYLFNKKDLSLVEKAVEQGRADRAGDLIEFMVKHSEVHGFVFDELWFDIGSHELLKEAEEFYSKKE